jgi:two-component system phosphate regulon response regulator OmpR
LKWRRTVSRQAFIERQAPPAATDIRRQIATGLKFCRRRTRAALHCAPMSKPRVLMVDDDAELSAMLAELLAREGWDTHSVLTADDGERALQQWLPEAVLLDVMLPDANGFDVCRRWRAAHPALGIVMLTARGDPMDRVLGLEIGADDYLPKPFEPRELVARVRALLRRQAPGRVDMPQLRFDGLLIDLLKREVLAGTRSVVLTSVEYKLLVALARTPGKAWSRSELSEAVQSGGYKPLDRTVDVQVARLRRKLAEAAPGSEWIDTVRGEGYVFVPRG